MKRRPALFENVQVGSLELSNRIVIAPMCQYSAENGCMNDWHLIHLGHLSISGAALLTVEATAVLPDGRITWADVGLWSDETEMAMSSTLERIRRWSGMPIGIQLNHAGRKASTEVPWVGGAQIASTRQMAGRRKHLHPYLTPKVRCRRRCSTATDFETYEMHSYHQRNAPGVSVST